MTITVRVEVNPFPGIAYTILGVDPVPLSKDKVTEGGFSRRREYLSVDLDLPGLGITLVKDNRPNTGDPTVVDMNKDRPANSAARKDLLGHGMFLSPDNVESFERSFYFGAKRTVLGFFSITLANS